ncbi:MAG: hypothetical protein M3186_01180 [Actinomycetota bacterium]|nr:hypothetical protein [Actinomycetota bacterium]
MDDSELQQLVIGLAAQIYFANRDGKDPHDPEVTAGLSRLAEDLAGQELEWSVELPRTPQALRAVITECMENAADQVSRRAYGALSHMINLFCDLALYAEQTSPEIDVPEFLRRAGLRAASGE